MLNILLVTFIAGHKAYGRAFARSKGNRNEKKMNNPSFYIIIIAFSLRFAYNLPRNHDHLKY